MRRMIRPIRCRCSGFLVRRSGKACQLVWEWGGWGGLYPGDYLDEFK